MGNSTIFLASLPLLLSACVHVPYMSKAPKTGTVIILNGPSAAGKSSIQRAFQALEMPNLWVKIGIDNLFDAPMPDITSENLSFWQKPNEIRWVTTSTDAAGNSEVALHVGEQGAKVAYAMNSAIAEYAANGCNVIVDYIAYKKEWFDDLQKKLAPYQAYYIAVDISLEELERREAARKTSPVGHARSHYAHVYGDKKYDLRVNSEKDSADIIAKKISEFIAQKR